METDTYFSSYTEWREAITVRCKIALTDNYCEERIRALRDPGDATTKQFVDAFGEDYLETVVGWFERAGAEN